MNNQPQDQPRIFLIEDDDDTRHVLRRNLQSDGYRVLVALDEEDARERAADGVRADLVLVDLAGKTVEHALAFGRDVRERAKYDGHTPLVVMPDDYGKDVEGADVNVGGNDWILYLGEDPYQLRNLLRRLLPPASPPPPDSRSSGPSLVKSTGRQV